MTVQHNVLHKFDAGLNASKNSAPLQFDLPVQQGWKVYYEELTAGTIRADDAYWLVAANGGGTIGAGSGLIAALAGNPRGARQVARILHSCSRKDNLPWFRVVNRDGKISLKHFNGYEVQKLHLEKEGIVFTENYVIDFTIFLWFI